MPKPNFNPHIKQIAEIIRVNHAGEYGAKRIYEGQIKFTPNLNDRNIISLMLKQEEVHLNYFEEQLKSRNIRPTIFMPLWHHVGYITGVVSAMMGLKPAMLVTDAVEEVIEQHYASQLNYLNEITGEGELALNIKKFRDDELEHKSIAVEHDSSKAYFAKTGFKLIKLICKSAIFLSKRL